jgi:hypothetical protein
MCVLRNNILLKQLDAINKENLFDCYFYERKVLLKKKLYE